MSSTDLDLHRLAEMIKDIKFTMFTTVNPDGSMHSRPMAAQKINVKTFDGRLWFLTKKDTLKVHDIEADQHVNLAYSNPEKQHYISVTGKASLSDDRGMMGELWTPALKAWFPEGINDPQMALIRVDVETAEIWDAPPSKLVQLVGMFKAAVTGKPYDDKKHSEHIDLNTVH